MMGESQIPSFVMHPSLPPPSTLTRQRHPSLVSEEDGTEVSSWREEAAEFHIYFGRGASIEIFQNPGNIWFRAVIESNLPSYSAISSSSRKRDKTEFISNLVMRIHQVGGRFAKKRKMPSGNPSQEEWYTVSMQEAHQKTGQALRDALLAKKKAQSAENHPGGSPQDTHDITNISRHSSLDLSDGMINLFEDGELDEVDSFVMRSIISMDSGLRSMEDSFDDVSR